MVSLLYCQVGQENMKDREIMKKHFCSVAGLVQGCCAPGIATLPWWAVMLIYLKWRILLICYRCTVLWPAVTVPKLNVVYGSSMLIWKRCVLLWKWGLALLIICSPGRVQMLHVWWFFTWLWDNLSLLCLYTTQRWSKCMRHVPVAIAPRIVWNTWLSFPEISSNIPSGWALAGL